ncbi:MAG: hypothetical protein M5R36_09330 [Deltaproteobacteria bacterium]|nr:hypothetical protein [Deltaproteobacteria bacterium]
MLDECLGRYAVRRVLEDAGERVEVHADHFRPGTPDDELIPAVAAHGWIFVTKDKAIRRHSAEYQAVTASRAAVLILTGKDMSGRASGEALVKAMPRLRRLLGGHDRPFVATISRSGGIVIRSGRRLAAGKR